MGLRLTVERALSHLGDPLLEVLAGDQRPGVACLILHSVCDRPRHKIDVTPGQLGRLLEAVRAAGAEVVALPKALELLRADQVRGRFVVLTFDDGYVDFASHAVPVLERYEAPATLSILAHHAETGEPFSFATGDGRGSLSWDQLRRLVDKLGERLTIANHSHRHRDFSKLDEASIRRDIELSQQLIETRLGQSPRYFTYPFGAANPLSDRLVEERFDAILGGTWGDNRTPADARRLRRVAVFGYDGRASLRLKALGRRTAYQRVRDRMRCR